MTPTSVCACGLEARSPLDGVSPLENDEKVVTAIRCRIHLIQAQDGKLSVGVLAFRKEDLIGKNKKSISLMRKSIVLEPELLHRAEYLNLEPGWAGNPVVAMSTAKDLRGVVYKECAKCACLYADPVTAEQAAADRDDLGECLGHASLKRHCEFKPVNDAQVWANLLSDLAEQFEPAIHAVSGVLAGEPVEVNNDTVSSGRA